MTLTAKRQRFVAEYLVDLNATQAAIRAGYSARCASEQGYEILRFPQVQTAIAKARRERAVRLGLSADWVVMELVRLHAETVATHPEVARRALRDIGEAIGMY